MSKKKYIKKKKYYSLNERRAYWIGVGICSAYMKEADKLLNSSNPKIQKSIRKGYHDDNYNDVSKKFR